MSWSTIASGAAIEVLSEDGATWRPGRLVHAFLSRPLYFVLLDGGAGRATVDAARVRGRSDPSATAAAALSEGFRRRQLVEAFVDGAWRPGVVAKVHVAGRERRYSVCLPHPRQQTEVGAGDIRARRDPAAAGDKQHKPVKLQKLGGQKPACRRDTANKRKFAGSATPSCSCRPCREASLRQFPTPARNSENENACGREKKRKATDDNAELLDLRDREEGSSERTGCGVRVPTMEEPKFHIKSLVEKCCSSSQFEKISSGILLDDPLVPENSGQDKPVSNNGEDLSKERPANCGLLRKHKGPRQHTSRENRRKSSRPQKLKIIEPSLEGDSMGNRPDNTVVQIRGLPTNKCSASTFSDNGFEAQEPFNEMEGSSDPSLVETSASDVQLSEAGHEGKIVSEPQFGGLPIYKGGASTFSDNGLEAQELFNVTEGSSDPCFIETSASGVQISEAGNEGKIVGEPQIGGLPINKCDASIFSDNGLEARGPFNVIEGFSDPSLVETSASGVQLSEAENEGKIVSEPQIGGLLINKYGASTFSDNGLEAQKTFNVIEGSSDPSMVENSASGVQLSEGGNEEQIDVLPSTIGEQLEKKAIIEQARAVFKTRHVKPPEERPSLPFEKCSFMWDSIESMEVFSLMPQHPHFRPLEEYQKDFREGMAIGLMVTFSNLVNSIRKLAITDHRDKFNDMLKILENLEAHGFDVQHLQDRLVELLRKKENQERVMNERSNLEVMLMKRKREKNQFDSELALIGKAIRELEQFLSCLQEEKVHISEQKRENNSTLDKLEEDLRRVESALRSATHDFEAVISAKCGPWVAVIHAYMGLPQSKKDIVATIKPGLKLLLYDYSTKLLHRIYEQHQLEEILKKAIMGESKCSKTKFNTELNSQQAKELTNSFQSDAISPVHNAQLVPITRDIVPYDPRSYDPHTFSHTRFY